MRNIYGRIIWMAFIFLGLFGMHNISVADQNSTNLHEILLPIPIGEYSIESTSRGDKISINDFGRLLIPGKPDLPSKIFTIAIPPGASLVTLEYEVGDEVILPGSYNIPPARLPRVIGKEDPVISSRDQRMYSDNYNLVYGKNDPYPGNSVELVGVGGLRKYNLVDVRVTPFTYHPQSGEVIGIHDLTLKIVYTLSEKDLIDNVIIDNLPRMEKLAEDFILNYDQAADWYPVDGGQKGISDFVIITLESLVSTVAPLVSWEIAKGRTAQVVTTSWINTEYSGYDLAEKIRNFLRDKYPQSEWGIQDALIIGHVNDIPMRLTAQDWGYGRVKTDLYYAELSYHDSLSWDSDGDHQWGEDTDPIDFYSEINIGRIPWSGATDVANICQKTIAYEQNQDPEFKKNILLLGGYFWNDDPNPITDNAVLMETKIDHPWMADWSKTRMYEQNSQCWSTYDCDYPLLNSNVRSVWSSGKFAFVNWAGHGSPTSSHIYGAGAPAFISNSDCSYLNDDYPSIIFADACSNANPDYLNIGQAMIRQGAVGFLGATQVAGGMPGWADPYDGSSQSLDYFFTTYVTSGDYTFGEAHQRALRDMYVNSLWGGAVYYQMFQWGSIWGNPDLAMSGPVMEIQFPANLPDYLTPLVTTTISVQIQEISDTCIPGTAYLHYRYDEGEFLSVPLTAVVKGLYEVELPAPDCNSLPEYYFSVEGVLSGVLYSPFDAPTQVFTAEVGVPTVIVADDFEADLGWTVENSAELSGGAWERGAPVGGGERGDPTMDYDGSGQCYLTENLDGDSDIDGGSTYLISPTLSLNGMDAIITYALWYTNSYGDDPNNDYFRVYLSEDDGDSWLLVETIGPQDLSGWHQKSLRVSDHIKPTSQTKIRFEASDLGSSSVVEAGIDVVNVFYVECVDFIYGDANRDENIDVADAVYLINYVFKGGPAPDPIEAGDANCDNDSNVADGVFLINYVFKGGPEPVCP